MAALKKKILFILSDTGGGHRASARAISEAIEFLHPGNYEVTIEDLWKNHMGWPICCLPDAYSWMTGPGKPVWHALWKATSWDRLQSLTFACISPFIEQNVVAYLDRLRPDIVISVHPLMNHLGVKWLASAGLEIPFITVVTDMVSLHPSWICPAVDRCFVPTDEAKFRALKFGMAEEKITVHGQPVDLKFSRLNRDKKANKRQLGIDQNLPAILLVAGGEGQRQLYRTARKIASCLRNSQLLIVAGRNRRLEQRLHKEAWEIPTRVFGFVDNMHELMGAADILITKAGPSTISEAFIAGLPLLISDYIPGQESGNVRYIEHHKAGAYAPGKKQLIDVLNQWLANGTSNLERLTVNGTILARPDASLHIAADICRHM